MEIEEEKTVTFSGHESQISSIVRVCREGGIFTDAELICDDGIIPVHRLVLGSVSEYLRDLLTSLPASDHAAILVPGVRTQVADQLVQFIYTGLMQLSQFNSWEVQELVLLLKIDPHNVVVDVIKEDTNIAKLDHSNVIKPFGTKMKPKKETTSHKNGSHNPAAVRERHGSNSAGRPRRTSTRSSGDLTTNRQPSADHSSSRHSSGERSSSNRRKSGERTPGRQKSGDRRPSGGGGADKLSDSPAASPSSPRSAMLSPRRSWSSSQSPRRSGSSSRSPRRAGSTALSPRRSGPSPRSGGGRYRAVSGRSGAGDPTVSSSGEFMSVLRPSDNSNVIKIVTSRKRHQFQEGSNHHAKDSRLETVRGRGRGKGGVLRSRGRSRGSGSPRVLKREETGNHDMENVETWVCAICGRYDPILPVGGEENTTEWIGCDCNRWFHKFCTKLKVVDDTFCCKLVQKTCLPH